ncbi:MAG: transcriptional repressor LexA [Azoarcus sp.]|jgi:repressor LexA|nr:transcriptional repressor LexA [Azoarcus sp.]
MSLRLTERQQEILDFIASAMTLEGRPPTRTEICAAFGFRSLNAAEGHLRALAAKGVIKIDEGFARGIRFPEPPGLPIVGRVAAGSPLLAVEHIEKRLQLDPELFSPRADYLLRVRGMSMRDAGIFDGDLLAVHRSGEARDGQIVVARLEEEVTVKTLRRRDHIVELLPANPDFAPIVVDIHAQQLTIEGVMTGLIRQN